MPLAAIEAMLSKEIGLDPRSVGRATIDLAVRRRREALGIETLLQYLEHVRRSPGELQELVEGVVIHNSWFFRERRSFEFVSRWCETTAPVAGGPLRVLSLGCAHGEEPYSLAMALLDHMGPAGEFQIDAIDISRQALEAASAGRYRSTAFQDQSELGFRSRYFELIGADYQVKEEVKRRVRFVHGNVLKQESYPPPETCHFVFCRNLLIYMDDAARGRTLALIRRVLGQGGHLLVGSAEGGRVPREHFETVQLQGMLGFRKRSVEVATDPRPKAGQTEEMAPIASQLTSTEIDLPLVLQHSTHDRAASPPAREAYCWEQAGLLGGDPCPRLDRYVTCSTCPHFVDHGRALLDRPAPPGYVETWTDAIRRPKEEHATEHITVLVFRIVGQWFALPADRVVLVANPAKVRAIPHVTGDLFLGLVNLVGIRLCVSLRAFLGVPTASDVATPEGTARRRMIAIGSTEQSWVFAADEVHSVRQFDRTEMDHSPLELSEQTRTFTSGTITWHEQGIGLLDADLLLASLARVVQ